MLTCRRIWSPIAVGLVQVLVVICRDVRGTAVVFPYQRRRATPLLGQVVFFLLQDVLHGLAYELGHGDASLRRHLLESAGLLLGQLNLGSHHGAATSRHHVSTKQYHDNTVAGG